MAEYSTCQTVCDADTVAILMCTKDGANYLHAQLSSLLHQDHKNWHLWVSDDGSQDDTINILQQFQQTDDRLKTIFLGPQKGFCQNFLSLVLNPKIQSPFYAYCDQDDSWHVNKLSKALEWLKQQPSHIPALYTSRSRLIDTRGSVTGCSRLFKKPLGFRNALVQSIAGGNTMVFNHAARDLLIKAGPVKVLWHDWWTYLLVSACGGQVYYDPEPSIDYRQHGRNLVGSNLGLKAIMARLRLLANGDFQRWNHDNIQALQRVSARMTEENYQTLRDFVCARQVSGISSYIQIRRIRIYRQSFVSQVGLLIAALLGKI